MLTIPTWGLWIMFAASAVGTVLLIQQLRALRWGMPR
jgi:hypothetical protein